MKGKTYALPHQRQMIGNAIAQMVEGIIDVVVLNGECFIVPTESFIRQSKETASQEIKRRLSTMGTMKVNGKKA
jgi:hypothetical protein